MIKTVLNLAWAWFKSNIKLPFNQDQLRDQALNIAYNQGLPALINSLESKVDPRDRDKLDHPMWQALKQAASSNDPSTFVQQAASALENSGEAERIISSLK